MKIISGKYKGLVLPRPCSNTRPTTNKVLQAIFSKLENYLDISQCVVYDLYAGTGALAFEALSRGCQKIYLNDQNRQTVRRLRQFIDSNEISEAVIYSKNAKKIKINNEKSSKAVVFLDPPYNTPPNELIAVLQNLTETKLIILEARLQSQEAYSNVLNNFLELNNFSRVYQSAYGDTIIFFIIKS
ncbi:MAG: RsmD family RNA methyltransferase [Bifidobacteriaceae bacterium]|jgi:16S rRNA (guanine966-N2)-methyltransferase|nr:RsmD family RNA methyltransferase [Bifidobacteriaceae bacterium]